MGGVDRLPSGRYRVRVIEPGTNRRLSIGTFKLKADAEQAFARAMADQGKGAWVPPDHGRVTLREYAPLWLESRLTARGEPLRPRVIELYEGLLRLHILPVLGDAGLARVSTASVRTWRSSLLASGVGASTASKSYRLLRTILNTAIEDGLIVANPCTIKGAGVESAEERQIPTIAQVDALVEAVPPRFRALVLLAAYGGLRKGELFGLHRRHVDLLHREITIETQRQQSAHGDELIGPPKSEAGVRTVTIPADIVPVIQEHLDQWASPERDGYVFIGEKGAPLRPHVWQTQWEKARRSLDLEHLHFHDLRHVAGTLAAATGAGTKELMQRLGHASSQAALRYQHATQERDRVIADGMDELIRKARKARNVDGAEVRRLVR
jgi:integrase